MSSITDYFYEFLDENIFENIVYFTNFYAVQTSQTRYKPTNYNEIKKVYWDSFNNRMSEVSACSIILEEWYCCEYCY